MAIAVKFIGALRHVSGIREHAFGDEGHTSVKKLINEIIKDLPSLKQSLIDLTQNTLVLVNGKEISVLDGLETKLNDGDEVVLIPFVHGG